MTKPDKPTPAEALKHISALAERCNGAGLDVEDFASMAANTVRNMDKAARAAVPAAQEQEKLIGELVAALSNFMQHTKGLWENGGSAQEQIMRRNIRCRARALIARATRPKRSGGTTDD